MPASSRIVMLGSPSPSQIAPSAPGPSDDSDETIIPVSNICWMYGTIDRARAMQRRRRSAPSRSGRSSRSCVGQLLLGVEVREGGRPHRPRHRRPELGVVALATRATARSSYGGTSARSSKNAWSMSSGVTPGMRAPSSRVSDNGL